MTATLKAGKLTADMVPLLTPGVSVLRCDRWNGDLFKEGQLYTVKDTDLGIVEVYEVAGAAVILDRFTYLGERLPDGWISWSGGDGPPVHKDKYVRVRFRDGEEDESAAWNFDWPHAISPAPDDITAFRLVEEPSTTEEGDYKRPKRGEVRVINGVMQRFVEADDRGDVWEILPAADQVEFTTPTPDRKDDLEPVAWRFRSLDGYGGWSYSDAAATYLPSVAYRIEPLYGPDAKARIEGLEAELMEARTGTARLRSKLEAVTIDLIAARQAIKGEAG